MNKLILETEFNDRYATEQSFRNQLKEYVLDRIVHDDIMRKEYQSIRGKDLKKRRKEFFKKYWVTDEIFRNNVNNFELINITNKKILNHIYILTNPAYPEHVKIGRTISPLNRLTTYNTGSPFKDYKYEFLKETEKAQEIENYFSEKYNSINEWYELTVDEAVEDILSLVN